jgi:hypothetical protein
MYAMYVRSVLHSDWKPVDQSAFGLIYGAILVLSMLMALQEAQAAPFRPAIILFGSVLAITLARAFSELLANGLQTGERILKRESWSKAWQRSRPILAVANLPTLIILAAGIGWIDFEDAVMLSQSFCVAILAVLGARVGWAVSPRTWLPVGGAAFAGGIGSALAAMKYAIQ